MTRWCRQVSRILLAVAMAMFVVSAIAMDSPPVAAAKPAPATTTWEPALQIAGSLPAWFPDIALDSAGTAHIVWNTSEATAPTTGTGEVVSQEPTERDFLMYGRFAPSGDPQMTDIGLSHGGEAIRNAILVDRTGTVDVLYRSSEHIWFIKAPIDGATRASAWSEPRMLSGTGGAYYAAIAQDSSGTLHVVYSENAPVDATTPAGATRRESMFYRRSTDEGATWSAPVRLSSPQTLHGTSRPQIRISGTTIVVAWDQGYDNITASSDPAEGAIRRSFDGGRTWQPVQTITDGDGPIEQVTFAFGQNDRALLVWRETAKDIVRYSVSSDAGATWSAPATIPGFVARSYPLKHQFDRYALVADGTSVFHLLAVGQNGNPDTLALFHLELHDGDWSAPQSVYAGGGLPEYPGIATDGGNRIVVTFFVRDNMFQVGNYRVWRLSGTMASPPASPHPVPTVAPTSAATIPSATPRIAASWPTPAPGVLEPEQRASIDHAPGIVSYGMGLLGAMGIVGMTVALRLWSVRRY
jgi:hypothetical protein